MFRLCGHTVPFNFYTKLETQVMYFLKILLV